MSCRLYVFILFIFKLTVILCLYYMCGASARHRAIVFRFVLFIIISSHCCFYFVSAKDSKGYFVGFRYLVKLRKYVLLRKYFVKNKKSKL